MQAPKSLRDVVETAFRATLNGDNFFDRITEAVEQAGYRLPQPSAGLSDSLVEKVTREAYEETRSIDGRIPWDGLRGFALQFHLAYGRHILAHAPREAVDTGELTDAEYNAVRFVYNKAYNEVNGFSDECQRAGMNAMLAELANLRPAVTGGALVLSEADKHNLLNAAEAIASRCESPKAAALQVAEHLFEAIPAKLQPTTSPTIHKTSERAPTEADADDKGSVRASCYGNKGWAYVQWQAVGAEPTSYPIWYAVPKIPAKAPAPEPSAERVAYFDAWNDWQKSTSIADRESFDIAWKARGEFEQRKGAATV